MKDHHSSLDYQNQLYHEVMFTQMNSCTFEERWEWALAQYLVALSTKWLFWINIMGMVLLPHPPLSSLVYSLLCQVQTPPAGSCWDVLEHWPQHCAQHPLPARQSPGAPGRTCLYTYDKILWSSVINFLIIYLILSFSIINQFHATDHTLPNRLGSCWYWKIFLPSH